MREKFLKWVIGENSMDDFWNNSETTPPTLDNFFDEESNVNWTGATIDDSASLISEIYSSNLQNSSQEFSHPLHRPSLSTGGISSILDNISIQSDSAISGIGECTAKVVGKAFGEKIESLKQPSVSLKWKTDGNGSCLPCSEKIEEIHRLKIRLERAYSRHNISLPPEDSIQKILLGHPISLESYKMIEDKVKLLDLAENTMDGSTILSVVIFLRNTMKKSFFLKELQKHPHSAQIYINYLKQRLEHNEALDILGMLGRKDEAAMFKYELAITSPTYEFQIRNLKNALLTHFSDSSLSHESKMTKQHLNLMEIQVAVDSIDSKEQDNKMFTQYPRASSLLGKPLLTSLYYCSMYHWHVVESLSSSPLYLKREFNMADKQFLWTVLRARGKVKHWPLPSDLDNLMAAKGLIGTLSAISGVSGGGKVIKNSLPLERVIETLASAGAPLNVLSSYISLLATNEAKIKFGLAYGCHLAVIEAYICQKDREGLENYLLQLTVGSPEYIKVECALKNTKWKV